MAKDADDKRSLDVAPYNQAVNTLAKSTVRGLGEFLGRICLPAAQELGLLMGDRVRNWRAQNTAQMLQNTQRILEQRGGFEGLQVHPRLAMKALEGGSWVDDDHLEIAWAGLLASSCTKDGRDESNLLFMNFLEQLASSQVRLLDEYAPRCGKVVKSGLVIPSGGVFTPLDNLINSMGITDLHRIDRELDQLVAIGLLTSDSGVRLVESQGEGKIVAWIALTALALALYVRCQGFRGSLAEFFDLKPTED